MISAWFSVIGLVADIVGVSIITYDVWPEYRLYRLRQALEWQHAVLLERAGTRQPDTSIKGLARGALDTLERGDVDRLRRRLGLPPIRHDRGRPTFEQIGRSQDEVETELLRTRGALANRARPPIGLGAALVFTGFILQLIGAWPH